MSKASRILTYLFVIGLILFAAGLFKLFSLRFEAGDVYPPYSTLRSDPLGAKAFYKSLANLKDLMVNRNYYPIKRLTGSRDTTLFLIGMDNRWMGAVSADTFSALSRLTASGGRLVISLYPSKKFRDAISSKGIKDQKREGDHGDKQSDTQHKASVSLTERWGVSLAYSGEHGTGAAYFEGDPGDDALPSSITCRTTLSFTKLNESWEAIYSRNGLPVIIERRFGEGSIVLYADSFILSNEAMMSERHPGLLAWFVGHGREILFDESHFGINKTTGIVGLARKYDLHWLFLALILITGLFIWKNSVPFVPPSDDTEALEKRVASERDHTEGLVGLLGRNIPPKDILNVCFKEWEKSFVHGRRFLKARVTKVKEVIDAQDRHTDPVTAYRKICKILSE